jgi:hypothetical protein
MMPQKPNARIQFVLRNAIFYLIALLIAFGLKYHYSRAGSDELSWILAPTASVVEHVSGIRFENEPAPGLSTINTASSSLHPVRGLIF